MLKNAIYVYSFLCIFAVCNYLIPEPHQPEDMPSLITQACTVSFCYMRTFAVTYQIFFDVPLFQVRSFLIWIVLTFKSIYFPRKEEGFSLR